MLEHFFALYFSSSLLESYQAWFDLEKVWCHSGWRQWTRSWYKSTQVGHTASFLTTINTSILLTDFGNHRVIKWNLGSTVGQIVAGGNGRGGRNDQLNHPHGVVVDRGRDSIFISDF